MNDEIKSQLIEKLNKAIKPEQESSVEDDGRVQYHQATHTLQINEEVHVTAEEEQEEKKKPDEDEMFESLIQKLNEQKKQRGHNKKVDII